MAIENYDVLFVPKGFFERNEKKFNVFLCRGKIFLPADLKAFKTTNPDTIGKRIKNGSKQASFYCKVVLADEALRI